MATAAHSAAWAAACALPATAAVCLCCSYAGLLSCISLNLSLGLGGLLGSLLSSRAHFSEYRWGWRTATFVIAAAKQEEKTKQKETKKDAAAAKIDRLTSEGIKSKMRRTMRNE